MTELFPWSLLVAWIAFLGFGRVHGLHYTAFNGTSLVYREILMTSQGLNFLVGTGLLVYYGFHSAWYWPVALLAVGLFVAGWLADVVIRTVGALVPSLLAFVGWPVAGWFVYRIAANPATWW
jgi:hypothetical protein